MADVQKNSFALSSATLMIAPAFNAVDVFSMIPATHSVGMSSQVNITLDSNITELLNGVAQATVDAKRTGIKSHISANVFEMTAQNALRAMASSTTAIVPKRGVLSAAAASGAVSLSITSDPVPGDSTTAMTTIADIPSGSTILIQRVNGEQDYVFPTKTSGAATLNTGTFTVPIAAPYAIPTNMSFAVGARVWVVQPAGVGNIDYDDLFQVKITGTLSNFDRPVTFVAPKVRMVKGFQMQFNETQYTSMPWDMQPLLLSQGEVTTLGARGADIGTRQAGLLYVGG
jgi:hypothetical protein